MTKFCTDEGGYIFLCIFGCRGAGYWTEREAQEAELTHVCRSAS